MTSTLLPTDPPDCDPRRLVLTVLAAHDIDAYLPDSLYASPAPTPARMTRIKSDQRAFGFVDQRVPVK